MKFQTGNKIAKLKPFFEELSLKAPNIYLDSSWLKPLNRGKNREDKKKFGALELYIYYG